MRDLNLPTRLSSRLFAARSHPAGIACQVPGVESQLIVQPHDQSPLWVIRAVVSVSRRGIEVY